MIKRIIQGNRLPNNNGLPQICVRNVYIDGLTLAHTNPVNLFEIRGATQSSLTHATNPLILPESITIKRVTGKLKASRAVFVICVDEDDATAVLGFATRFLKMKDIYIFYSFYTRFYINYSIYLYKKNIQKGQ